MKSIKRTKIEHKNKDKDKKTVYEPKDNRLRRKGFRIYLFTITNKLQESEFNKKIYEQINNKDIEIMINNIPSYCNNLQLLYNDIFNNNEDININTLIIKYNLPDFEREYILNKDERYESFITIEKNDITYMFSKVKLIDDEFIQKINIGLKKKQIKLSPHEYIIPIIDYKKTKIYNKYTKKKENSIYIYIGICSITTYEYYIRKVRKIFNIISPTSKMKNNVVKFNNLHIPEKYYDDIVLFIYDNIIGSREHVSLYLEFLSQIDSSQYFIEKLLEITIENFHNPIIYDDTYNQLGINKTNYTRKNNIILLIQFSKDFKNTINIIEIINMLFNRIYDDNDFFAIKLLSLIINKSSKEFLNKKICKIVLQNIKKLKEDKGIDLSKDKYSNILLLNISELCNTILL